MPPTDTSVEHLSDEELFAELREQISVARNGGQHDRERTRAIAAEATKRGWNIRGGTPPHEFQHATTMPPTDTSVGEYSSAFETLLTMLREPDCNLSEVAAKANVSYQSLTNWVSGRTKSFNLLDGERVYHALTGKTFLQ